jgi:alkanesulfonate monooxygenase SsuD/methylene tetrahydromethanopterin reductase-like flavin-dependent oxidoreductase (luciferase family)
VTDGSDGQRRHALDQVRWFGGMVGNHVVDIVNRYGADGGAIPTSLSDYIKDWRGYDYNTHGRAGNEHTEFISDEIVERFCLVGPPEAHIDKLKKLESVGAGHFGLYLQHDAQDATLAAYGERVIPAINEMVMARG